MHEHALKVEKRVPDFFIVGHAKSGTTALYEMLRRHPQIYMPDAKEPWFFANDPRSQTSAARSDTFDPGKAFDDYLSLFEAARPDQRIGEASTGYIWSPTAASRIAAARPDARIIVILREPASFLHSLHLQLLQNHNETKRDLRKAMSLEADRREGRRIPRSSLRPGLLQYSELVHYVAQLRRYHAAFAPEQVLVLIYDDFRADNEDTVRKVLRFLEVDENYPIDVLRANETVRMRSQQLDDLVHAVSVGRSPITRALKATVKTLTPQGLRREAFALTRRRVVFGEPKPPDEKFMTELRLRFKPEVAALSEYLGRDLLTLWGYDRL